jgi:hypothetical protein
MAQTDRQVLDDLKARVEELTRRVEALEGGTVKVAAPTPPTPA